MVKPKKQKRIKEGVELPEELMNALEEIEAEYAEISLRREAIRDEIKQWMIDNESDLARCSYCSVRMVKGQQMELFDKSQLKKDMPKVYEQYIKIKIIDPYIRIFSAANK